MKKSRFSFANAVVELYAEANFAQLDRLSNRKQTVLLTDENVFKAHSPKFRNRKTIVVQAGEAAKQQATVDNVVRQLLELGADRHTTLVGVGGGVVTDLTGYIAAVYMRGIRHGFVPTSLLAMVDAAIGGKNGINVDLHKNMVGTVKQPEFILYDYRFLESLPKKEWRNGFAEIIKHAAIRNKTMFKELQEGDLEMYIKRKRALFSLINRNALLKMKLVQQDEMELGDRKLLNFGHTIGHALENQYRLTHGEAIAVGMHYAAKLSTTYTEFRNASAIEALLQQYELPTDTNFDSATVLSLLSKDKKKKDNKIQFVLLKRIGKAVIQPLSVHQIAGVLR